MLVLNRRRNESVVIVTSDGVIEVMVTGGGPVKLGVRAPRSVPVHRKEVYDAIQRSKPVEEV
jgi:carbon storage regulator